MPDHRSLHAWLTGLAFTTLLAGALAAIYGRYMLPQPFPVLLVIALWTVMAVAALGSRTLSNAQLLSGGARSSRAEYRLSLIISAVAVLIVGALGVALLVLHR